MGRTRSRPCRGRVYCSVKTENDVGDRISSLGKNGVRTDSSQVFTPAQLDKLRESEGDGTR
jgi:hypothetical protein